MRPALAPLALGAFCVLLALLAACDSATPDLDRVTFDGVTYTALGGATLEPTGSGLRVGSGASADEYGVRVDFATTDLLDRADLRVLPVALPDGSRWGLQLFADVQGTSTDVATVWNEAVTDSTHQLLFDFDPATGATAVTFAYYLDGRLLFTVPDVPLSLTGGRLRTQNAGQGNGDPQSVHVIRDGSRYVVATDYGGDPPFAGGGCAGALLQVDFPGIPSAPFCADYVEATPNQFALQDGPTAFEVRARVPLDAFTLTSGTVAATAEAR
jgi:hypothetical protein